MLCELVGTRIMNYQAHATSRFFLTLLAKSPSCFYSHFRITSEASPFYFTASIMSFFDTTADDTSPPSGDSISARLTAVSRNIMGTGSTTPRPVLAEESGREAVGMIPSARDLRSALQGDATRGKLVDCRMLSGGVWECCCQRYCQPPQETTGVSRSEHGV